MLKFQYCLIILFISIPIANSLRCLNCSNIISDLSMLSLSIQQSCNESISASSCQFYINIDDIRGSSVYSFAALSSLPKDKQIKLVTYRFNQDNSANFTSEFTYNCYNEDHCSSIYAMNMFNYSTIKNQSLQTELQPLLVSSLTIKDDFACFNSLKNIDQCQISTIQGQCVYSQNLLRNQIFTQSCRNSNTTLSNQIQIYDSYRIATFNYQCNRSLCNGELTASALKQILLRYDVTKTIDGRLFSNRCTRLTYSFLFLLSVFIF